MILYKDIFGCVRYFPYWKDAISCAKDRMVMIMDSHEDFNDKIAEKALDDFKDLCVLEHMYTEAEIYLHFPEGVGSLTTGICTLTYIPTTENCTRVLKYLYDIKDRQYSYATPSTIKKDLEFNKVGSVVGSLIGLRRHDIVKVKRILMPDGQESAPYYCYNNGKHYD